MIWFHIGSPKTGTTALQDFLNTNVALLRDTGVNYVSAGRKNISHNSLPIALRQGNAVDLLRDIVSECERQPDVTHIVSSEMLFDPAIARYLCEALPDRLAEQAKIIGYVRRQDHYLEVLYKQLVKNGRVPADRQAFLQGAHRRVRYLKALSTYAEKVGAENVVACAYDRTQFVDGDIIEDFAGRIGLTLTTDFQRNTAPVNRTLSVEASEILGVISENTDINTREVIRELIRMGQPEAFRTGDVFSLSERQDVVASFAEENEALVETFMPGQSGFFAFDDPSEDAVQSQEDRLREKIAARETAEKVVLTAVGTLQREAVQSAISEVRIEDAKEALDGALPPTWYEEIYPGGLRDGFYHKFGAHSCSFVDRESSQLVVSFDNLHNVGNKRLDREPWAQKFCAEKGWSHLGIYAQTSTWFRDPMLIRFFEDLRDWKFFEQFSRIGFCGTSMGGFAALTFSSFAPGATVAAFSPQTTLDEVKVPWEHRFAKGRAADWSLPYSDACDHVGAASAVYLIYDPLFVNDRKHIERLEGDNLIALRGIGLGHKSALALNRMGHLKMVMEKCLRDDMDPQDFYRAIRDRKDLYIYRQNIEDYLAARGKDNRIESFRSAFKSRKKTLKAKA